MLWAVVAVASLVGSLGATVAPAQAQSRDRAISRQDLALASSDLTPGYEERSWQRLVMGETPLESRLLTRIGRNGPNLLYSVAFQARGRVTQANVDLLADEVFASLTDCFAQVAGLEVTASERMESPGVGDVGALMRFRYRFPNTTAEGDDALLVSGREEYVTVLAALSQDGRAAADLRQYARIVDGRVRAELGPARAAPAQATRAPATGIRPPAPDAAFVQLADLPTGFESFNLPLPVAVTYVREQNVGVSELLYRRRSAAGGIIVWNVALRTPEPASAEDLRRWSGGFFGFHLAHVRETEYSDFTSLDPPAVGEVATLYGFHHAAREYPISGDSALLAFRRGEIVVLLLVENLDGRAVDDVLEYGNLLDGRLQREAGAVRR
jgi:hypothetical protein